MDDFTIIHEGRVCKIPKNQKKFFSTNDKYISIKIKSMTIGSELVNGWAYSSSIAINLGKTKVMKNKFYW